jgi:hypothetical protein
MRRDKKAFSRELRRLIAESSWSPYQIALRACLTMQVLSKIYTTNDKVRRGATEAQVLQIAAALWCDARELQPLQQLLDERDHGCGRLLLRLLERNEVTAEQVAIEACLAPNTVQVLLAGALIPQPEELMRLFIVTVVRDGSRRAKINRLLELAGYYQLLPPLPPLSRAA